MKGVGIVKGRKEKIDSDDALDLLLLLQAVQSPISRR
jgi:hypothetical protein